jgi:polysaccharide biosynthesis transport protein
LIIENAPGFADRVDVGWARYRFTWDALELDVSIKEQLLFVLDAVWYRKWWLMLTLLCSAFVASVIYSTTPKQFESKTEMLLLSKQAGLGANSGQSLDGEVGVALQSGYLSSQENIEAALALLAEQSQLAIGAEAVSAIQQNLSVTVHWPGKGKSSSSTDFPKLQCRYRDTDPQTSQQILDAVCKSFQQYLDRTYRQDHTEVTATVRESLRRVTEEIQQLEMQEIQLRKEAPQLFLAEDSHSTTERQQGVLELRSGEFQRALIELANRRSPLEQRRREIQLLMNDPSRQPQLEAQVSSWLKGSKPAALEIEDPGRALAQEHYVLKVFGAEHWRAKIARHRIEFAEQQKQQAAGIPPDLVGQYLGLLEWEIREIEAAEKELHAQLNAEYDQIERLSDQRVRKRQLDRSLARSSKIYDELLAHLKALDLAHETGGVSARVVLATAPGVLIQPLWQRIWGASLAVGLLCGLGFIYLLESDLQLWQPAEVQNLLEAVVLGCVPPLAGERRGWRLPWRKRPSLLDGRGGDVQAEAFGYVRSSLQHRVGTGVGEALLITSARPGDGKSTVASRLAVSMARSGSRVLLIDADLRRPTLAAKFGLGRRAGLANLLGGQLQEMGEAMAQIELLPNLTVIPAGNSLVSAVDLFAGPKFEELLAVLKQSYDVVLIDGPPLLCCAETMAIASAADAVVPVVRLGASNPHQLLQLREILRELGTPVLGAVANVLSRRMFRSYRGYYTNGYRNYGVGTPQPQGRDEFVVAS